MLVEPEEGAAIEPGCTAYGALNDGALPDCLELRTDEVSGEAARHGSPHDAKPASTPGHDDAQEVTILRSIAADIRTAVLLGVGILALHGWWFVHSEHQADVISGFGVATAVLGILVAAQHLIKVGIETKARDETGTLSEEHEQDVDSVADKAARRIFRQEVVGASLIAVGTLLNGYATALARLLSLPV